MVDKPKMRIEMRALDNVQSATRNPRRHALDRIAASIRRFGFVAPLVENASTGRLVAGHGRVDALRKMRDAGEAPPACVHVVDGAWHVPVLTGVDFANESEAEAYLVADNKLTEQATWIVDGDDGLAAMLDQIRQGDASLLVWENDSRALDEAVIAAAMQDVIHVKPMVVVECRDDAHQREILETCAAKGWSCRALI